MSIQQKQSRQTHEAIVFFSESVVSKEMLYTEFEALLDCVVPMRDFVGLNMQAAYVRLDEGLSLMAVVLFNVPFNQEGFPDLAWNVPLRQLSETAARGPDMGGGPIRLATRSQCPIAGQESKLWDIEFGIGGNTLNLLQEKLRANRLGLDAVDSGARAANAAPEQAWVAPQPVQSPASQTAPLQAPSASQLHAGESADAMLAMMQQSNQQMSMVKDQHQRELMNLQQRLAAANEELQVLGNEEALLAEQLGKQAQEVVSERERGERKLQQLLDKARAQVASVRKEVSVEHEAALAARERQMTEELEALQKEREVQEDQLLSLRTEITELRRDKMRLMGDGADKFFDNLNKKGVKFVSYQPGAGHITIAMEDLQRFVDETESFVAAKCNVSVEQYRRWLAHHANPVCQGSGSSGGPCAKPVAKLLKPADFVGGVHDRCDVHKQVPRSKPPAKSD